jgi:hypothetical protein
MVRKFLLASALLLGATGAQAAQLVNINGEQQVVYDEPSPNVVGGGAARLTGDAASRTVVYQGAVQAQPTHGVPQLANVNGEQRVVYAPAAQPSRMLAGAAAQPRG